MCETYGGLIEGRFLFNQHRGSKFGDAIADYHSSLPLKLLTHQIAIFLFLLRRQLFH